MVSARVLVVAIGFASGCDDGPMNFGDRRFVSESIDGRELVPGTRLTIEFHGSAIGAYAGCNSLFGKYHLADGELVSPGLGQTEKGCTSSAGDLAGQEEWFREFLGSSPAYMLDEPHLVLSDDDVTLVLVDDPDRPLESSHWDLRGLLDHGLTYVEAHAWPASLELIAGRMTIVTPCAEGTASYVKSDASIMLDGVTIGDAACADEELAAYDLHMREVLADGRLEWSIRSNELWLQRDAIGLVMFTD